MFCHAFVTNFAGMMTVRVLLGAFEYVYESHINSTENMSRTNNLFFCRAGFFPAAMYLCSQWYPRNQLAFRLSLFMAVASASGIFSGLMAAAIAQMGGIGGFSSWNWIFLIEGSVTILLGISTLFLLVDSPRRSGRWLLAHEIRYLEIMNRIKDSGSHSSDATFSNQFSDLKVIVMDWRYWAFGVLLHNVGACGYGEQHTPPNNNKKGFFFYISYTNDYNQASSLPCPPSSMAWDSPSPSHSFSARYLTSSVSFPPFSCPSGLTAHPGGRTSSPDASAA